MRTYLTCAAIGLTAVAASRSLAQCEIQKLTASDAAERDTYGISVGASPSTIVIGAPAHDGAFSNSGVAYLYTWDGAAWGDEVQLTAPDAAEGDGFATAVAIDGDAIVCGAPFDDDLGSRAGAAYVFRRVESAWVFEARLQADDGGTESRFGSAVAIDGDTVLIGAPGAGESGYSGGSAFVFRRSGPEWVQEADLSLLQADAFGSSVAIDDGVALVGAPGRRTSDIGLAYVFRFDGVTWSLDPEPLRGEELSGASFGAAVDIDGDRALVGAPAERDNVGAAYAFRYEGGAWDTEVRLSPPDPEAVGAFGAAVAMDGPNALIGSPFGGLDSTGAACLFDTVTWADLATLTASDAAETDSFGAALAVRGEVTIIGAYKNDDAGNASGSAYAYATRGPDCNGNGRGDCLDIALGTSDDCNADGLPDECAPPTGYDGITGRSTILVPADYPTIQAALDAATDGDEVVVANGTYTGEGNYDLDFKGKAVVLRSEDCDPDRCIIDCDLAGRGFFFHSGEGPATQVSGFTIMRGRDSSRGGGIYIDYSSPTITNCTILLCYSVGDSGSGAGLYCVDGNPALINCDFLANQANPNSGSGGGVLIKRGRPAITGCTFVGNTAGRDGALVLAFVGPTTVRDCLFVANRGTFGQGAVLADPAGRLRVIDCVFDSNFTLGWGGAFFYEGPGDFVMEGCLFLDNRAGGRGGAMAGYEGDACLSDCSFSGNTAGESGGALANYFASTELIDCVFEDNTAAGDGGAIHNVESDPLLTGCTVRDNTAARGGGMFSEPSALPVVRDSRFCGNDPTNIEGDYTDDGGNDVTRLCTAPCPADVDGDSIVGMSDLLAVLTQWGPCPGDGACPADVDENGVVDFADVLALIAAWGACPAER